MKSDRSVLQLRAKESGDELCALGFLHLAFREVGGDDIEREEKVGACVGDRPTAVGNLGALKETEKSPS
jgi:hypothetical protein